uniref:MYC binding protein n=1 Tax=Hucho hucho TaxID=62062 RepID=A0A4W5LC14_9TELE
MFSEALRTLFKNECGPRGKTCLTPLIYNNILTHILPPISITIVLLFAVLVALYEETDKPNNALDFLKHHLGVAGAEPADVEALHLELTELQQKWDLLMEENKDLRNRLLQYEPAPEDGAAE